jgi:hypothetical protein
LAKNTRRKWPVEKAFNTPAIPSRWKLTIENVLEIKRLLADGVYQRAIAKKMGVSQTMIGYINRGEQWTDVNLP